MRLDGKVVLISGGAKGQGATEAKLFAEEGASVIIADVLESNGKRLEEKLTRAGYPVRFIRLDVTSEDDWQSAVLETVRLFGKLDVLVNNAAIYQRVNVEETSLEEWKRVIDVNFTGVFLGTKHAIPEMRRAGGGSIVNISSTAGLVGSLRGGVYGASKGGVRIFTKTTAIQHAHEGIRANSIHPGPIDTDMITLGSYNTHL